MLYTKKALQMGAIAVGLAAFAGQSSLAESAKKEDSKPSVRTETMQVMPELTMASHFVGVPVQPFWSVRFHHQSGRIPEGGH